MTGDVHESDVILDSLLQMDVNRADVHVCVASYVGDDNIPIFQRLPLSEKLTASFRAVIAKSMQKWRKERREYQLVLWPHLDGTIPASHEFEYLDLKTHNSIQKQLEALRQPIIGFPLFDPNDESVVSGIRFYVMIVDLPNGKPCYFFRTYTPKRELSRSRWFAAFLTNNQFDTINTPTFLFDDHIDCFSTENHMFVVQKSNFQDIFRFFEKVAQVATQTLAVIKVRIPIKNFDEFAADCQAHVQKLAKLKNIAAQPYLNTISIPSVRSVITRLRLRIKIEDVNGTEMLVYDRADRWALLRLLDDDFVQSLLTGNVYEVGSKRPVS